MKRWFIALAAPCLAQPVMAQQVKITQLPVASTLQGTEIVPVVQGGAGKQTTITAIASTILPTANTWSGLQTLNGGFGGNRYTYGTYATAANCYAVTNSAQQPQVTGFSTPSQAALFWSRDSTGCYIDNTAPPLIANVAGTFTTTTFVPTSALSGTIVAQLRVGMMIDTSDGTKYTGTITGWASNGTSITVSGWFQQGNQAAGQTPSGPNAYVNPINKVWAGNFNVYLNSNSWANQASGLEIGLINNQGVLTANDGQNDRYLWGFDAVNLGTYASWAGHTARGAMNYGFYSESGELAGFSFNPKLSSETGVGFACNANFGNACFVGQDTTHGNMWSVAGSIMGIGGRSSANTPTINMYSEGTSTVDVSITATGGTGVNGHGVLTIGAATVAMTGSATISAGLQFGAQIFSNLPSCTGGAGAGSAAYITDASAAITTWHQAVTSGGGANKAFVLCNGSSWNAIGY